ncbi:MAG: hypothetical protein D6776_12035 [Planctomycetota bacterium]|nr:MAG: hypothetical protein D6776_12035 [Planctomycetota bacterium]
MARWLCVLTCALATGCVSEPTIDPVVDIEAHKLVVLPFSEPHLARYESRRGNTLAKMVADWIAEKRRADEDDAIDVVRFDELVHALRDVDPRDLEPLEVARRTGADYALVGEITRYETRRRGDVGVIRGRAEVRLDVLDVAAGPDRPIFSTRIAVQYPPDDYTMAGVMPLTEGDEKAIETGLMLRLTERIGELFTYHTVRWHRR